VSAFRSILITAATIYLVIVLALWALQGKLIYPAPQDRPAAPGGFVEVTLIAQDGVRTRAFYRAAKPGFPTAVFYHGNGETLAGSLYATRALADAGYGLFLPEFRGYGGLAGTPGEKGFYADGRAALSWLAAQGIGPDETVLAGHSIGTGTAVQMAQEFDVAALMLSAPYRSLTDLVSEKFAWLPAGLLLRDRFESEAKLARYDKPVLIVHGARDTLIPPAHGRALQSAAPNAVFELFETLGHNDMYDETVVQAQLEWLQSNNFASGAANPS
jgi:fermentation-respiration switch protein FrsA (DUF1100 family)